MMRLGAFVHETGQHVAAWRHPGAHAHAGVSFAEAVQFAQTAERGKFDFLFLADTAAVSTAGTPQLSLIGTHATIEGWLASRATSSDHSCVNRDTYSGL